MKPSGLSIAGLMALVGVVALGVFGLREGTEVWASATFMATAVLLLGAVLNVLHGRGARRATWGGFALFGWAYLAWSFCPWSGMDAKAPPMVTAWMLDELNARIHPEPEYFPNPQYSAPPTPPPNLYVSPMILAPGAVVWRGNVESYRQVGHCLCAVLLGGVGALWARIAYARGQGREQRRAAGEGASPQRHGEHKD
jgi:hypothetical protein